MQTTSHSRREAAIAKDKERGGEIGTALFGRVLFNYGNCFDRKLDRVNRRMLIGDHPADATINRQSVPNVQPADITSVGALSAPSSM